MASKRALTETINGTSIIVNSDHVRIFNGRKITLSLHGVYAKEFMRFMRDADAFLEAERIRAN